MHVAIQFWKTEGAASVIFMRKSKNTENYNLSWPENQGILFFYISQTLQMNWISFMASLLNAVL